MLRSGLQKLTSHLGRLPASGLGAAQQWRDTVALVASCSAQVQQCRDLRGCALGTGLLPASATATGGEVHARPAWGVAQQRSTVSVPVDNNDVDRAFRKLKRTMLTEGITRKLRASQVYLKPSEERVRGVRDGRCVDANPDALFPCAQILEEKATDKRLRKRAMKQRLSWILRKKDRGF
jgi:ribosomal protein S21